MYTNNDARKQSPTIGSIILRCQRDEFRKLFQDPKKIDPALLMVGEKLTYEYAVEVLRPKISLVERRAKKQTLDKFDSELLPRLNKEIAILEEMKAMLRDATILYAVSKDDVTLLDRLQAAGGTPTEKMGSYGNGKQLKDIVTTSQPKIKAWLTPKPTSAAGTPGTMFSKNRELAALEAEKARLELEYAKKMRDLLAEKTKVQQDALSTARIAIKVGGSRGK